MPVFEAALLPDQAKQNLCRTLLEEFGAESIQERDDELIHGCLLPMGNHRDQMRNPTASLNWDKLTYKCLGCGAGGGLLWFIATCRRTSSMDARKWLDESAGLGNNLMPLQDLLKFFDALYAGRGRAEAEPIPTYSERVLAPWALWHPYMTDPPEWVDGANVGGRGVPDESMERFRVGYAEQYEWQPRSFSERIVIPQFWQRRLVGWQTRRLADDGSPKYVSSPSFPKDQTLYNHDPYAGTAIVVESPLSTLRHAHHLPVVATFSASITSRQIRLLQKYRRVILFMDNDKAGWDAMYDLVDDRGRVQRVGLINALAPYVRVDVAPNPYAADPADLTDDVMRALVADAVPWPVYSPPTELLTWGGE